LDIILCLLCSLILVISLATNLNPLSFILGAPFLFFIPGYLLIYFLFPTMKKYKGLDILERTTLSIGLSIVITSLIGFGLNFTGFGIALESVIAFQIVFVFGIGFLAYYKWSKTVPEKRFTFYVDLSFFKSEDRLARILTMTVFVSVIVVSVSAAFIIMNPQRIEPLTEFYLFDFSGGTGRYPKDLTKDIDYPVSLEINNHEFKTVNYTVDVWLVNQSAGGVFSDDYSENATIYNMWFFDKLMVTLDHIDVEVTKTPPQWVYNYSFIINRSGSFKLTFLLFTSSTDDYVVGEDYRDASDGIFEDVYREVHLWVDVYYRIPPMANFTGSVEKPTTNDTIVFSSNSTSVNSSIVWWEWDFGDGTISSGETTGLKFDGIDDYVDCGNNLSLQPVNGTIEVRFNSKDNIERRRIFTGSYWSSLRRFPTIVLSNNFLVLTLTNNTNIGWEGHTYYADFKTDEWYHIAVSWDGSFVSFYVEGMLMQTDNQSVIPAGNDDIKRIGALSPPDNPDAFYGSIKDIRIYNRSLSRQQILNNYLGEVSTDGLVSWWSMNHSGPVVVDWVGGNNGTIFGADWVNQAAHKYGTPGTYEVTLTVSNEYRQIHSISKTVIVN